MSLGYFFLIVIYIEIANARNSYMGRDQNKRKIASKIIFHCDAGIGVSSVAIGSRSLSFCFGFHEINIIAPFHTGIHRIYLCNKSQCVWNKMGVGIHVCA